MKVKHISLILLCATLLIAADLSVAQDLQPTDSNPKRFDRARLESASRLTEFNTNSQRARLKSEISEGFFVVDAAKNEVTDLNPKRFDAKRQNQPANDKLQNVDSLRARPELRKLDDSKRDNLLPTDPSSKRSIIRN